MKNLRHALLFAWPFIRPYSGRLFAGLLFGVLFGLSNAALVGATKTIFDRLVPATAAVASSNGALNHLSQQVSQVLDDWLPRVGQSLTWTQFLGGLLLLPGLMALRGLLSYLSGYCIGWVGEHVNNDLRVQVLEKLNSLSLDFFDSAKMGDLITRVQGDTSVLHNCLDRGVADGVKEPCTIVGVLGALLWLDWKLTLLSLVFFPFCVIPIRVLGQKTRRATQVILGQTISQSSLLIESLTGIRVVKAFGLESEQSRRFREHSTQIMRHNIKRAQAKQLINPIIEVISMLGVGFIIVYVITSGTKTADLVAFLTGMVMFYTPIKKLAAIHVVYKEASVAVDRLKIILELQPSVQERVGAGLLPSFHEALEFQQVGFRYGTAEVLRNISLKIPRGFRLGIAGESGCGKSTLLNLLFRFYDPTAGVIRVDGRDSKDVRIADLRSQLALVSQEVVLFDLSVAENIGCGKAKATRAEIEAAAKAAYAHEFILQLPEGYDTMIGERGVRLSGGQRQRLAIARAFIRNAPILVLDEATAALDAQSEQEVQRAIDHLVENRTVICVAHRLATLRSMDEIIVLASGEIVERGSFEALTAQRGQFAAMAARQGIL